MSQSEQEHEAGRAEALGWGRRSQISTADDSDGGTTAARGPASNLSGTRISHYAVGEVVGSGAGGTVFSAHDPKLKRKVALKVLHPAKQSDAVEQERFVQEAQVLARLKHPNIVAVHEVGITPQGVFLVMEHVEGVSLDRWLKQEKRSVKQILKVFIQAGEGLLAAHEQHVVHRDFKPANVLVTARDEAKVIDFGLAKISAEGAPEPVVAGGPQRRRLAGTPAYMAPEQFMGGPITAQMDQFSFCVALWEALYSQRPFEDRSLAETERRVCTGDFNKPPPGAVVPAWVVPILKRGLAVGPADRWSSMAELLAKLRDDPTRRRRILGMSVLGAAIVAVGAVAWQLKVEADERATRVACADSGAAIDALWNEDVMEKARAALIGTGVAYAPTTFEKVVPWVNRFTAAWRDTYIAACVEEQVDGTRSTESFAAVHECLDAQEVQFAAFMKALVDAGPTVVNKAVDAAAGLPKPTDCVDDGYLAVMPRLPAEPELRARAKEIAEQQATASMYDWQAKYDQGLQLAREALAAAESLGNAYQIAHGHYQIAGFLKTQNDYKGAVAEHTKAFLLAGEQGNDRLAAINAIQNGFIMSSNLDLTTEAELWNSLAAMALKRGGESEGLEAANLHGNLASLAYKQGNYKAGVKEGKEAYRIREKILGPDHPYIGGAFNSVAMNSYALEDMAGAVAAMQEAYRITVNALGDDHPDTAITLSNLATIQAEAGDWTGALNSFVRAHDVLVKVYGPEHGFVAQAKNNIGAAYSEMNDYKSALKFKYEGLAIVEKAPEVVQSEVALMLNNIAADHMSLAEYDEARRAYQRSIAIREEVLAKDHPDLAVTLSSLAALELGQANLELGASLHRRALKIRESQLPAGHPSLAYNHYGLGDYHMKKGELDQAVARFRKSLELRAAATPERAFSLTGLGEALIEVGQLDEAVRLLEEGLEIRRKTRARPGFMGRTQFHLGRALWELGQDRARARTVVDEAQANLAAAPASFVRLRDEVATWLQGHMLASP